MATSQDSIEDPYEKAVDEIFDLYDKDELDECIDKAEALLRDTALPRYWRIRLLCVLANTVPDWIHATDYHLEAEVLYRQMRQWHPPGIEDIDEIMDHLRTLLDDVRTALDEDNESDDESDDGSDEENDRDIEQEHENDMEGMERRHYVEAKELQRLQTFEEGVGDNENTRMASIAMQSLQKAAAETAKEPQDFVSHL
jgi:hypothetical protein